MRSVHLHKDKAIFQLDKLPADRFAAALGLPGAPKIKFLAREKAKQRKNASRELEKEADEKKDSESEGESSSGSEDEELVNDDGAKTEKAKKVRFNLYA